MNTKRYESIFQRIKNGEKILIDGATGTECERRGAPQVSNTWNVAATLSHPELLQSIHEEYIDCGAEIIITNTFDSSRHALRSAGMEERFEEITNEAVRLASIARANSGRSNVLIAGGITHHIWTDDKPSMQELETNSRDQAVLMASAGCDLIMLEMLVNIDRLTACIDGAQASGLPVWVGLCLGQVDGEICLRDGESLVDALSVIKSRDIPLINIMNTEVKYVDKGLDILDKHWNGPVGVYAHVCEFTPTGEAIYDDMITPEGYALEASRWLDRGVQVIGGCCGVRKEHICALQPLV